MSWQPKVDKTRYRIRSRIRRIEATSHDVREELARRGITASPSQFSEAINGRLRTPKSEMIVNTTDAILREWESNV